MLHLIKKSIRAKLTLSIGIVTLLLLVVYITYSSLTHKLNYGVDSFGFRYLPSISAILNADRDLYQAYVAQLKYKDTQAASERDSFDENAQQAKDRMYKYKELMKEYSEVQSKLESFDQRFNSWKQESENFFRLVDSGNIVGAEQLLSGSVSDKFSALRDLYDAAGEYLDGHAKQTIEQLDTNTLQNERRLLIFVVLALIVSGVITYLIPKATVDGINELAHRIEEISKGDGDLTQRINSSKSDELGNLANQFDGFISKLQHLIKEISQGSNQLNDSSNNLRVSYESSQQLNSRQSQSLEMIATAVNEFSASVREVAENAQNASQVTTDTVNLTREGVGTIEQSVRHIQELSDSISNANLTIETLAEDSDNIASVLDVIRNIAEQTNLLALNAAIEAARAGEQGRGFAVVADEVRSLASKTQQSTEEIQQMIDKLQSGVQNAVNSIKDGADRVQKNVELTSSTQTMFENIQSSTEQVNDMASQIAAATEEQSTTSEEINSNLITLKDGNREGMELAEKIDQIATEIDGSSEKLAGDVNQFIV
ncbi:methyl-accepting chemotaxis protein [Vibrio sp. HN007]|uniref:methyl-accepting chemotaxis protein n=1 Tax=Vibrio iocasae TaxID=3098914 RepID=UPI0035D51F0D